MDEGASVDAAVDTLLEKDDDATVKQIHGVDRWGNTVTFSGDECVDWYGDTERDASTVAGNTLGGEAVVDAVATTFEETDPEQPLPERLLEALIYRPDQPALQDDLRVDDHEDPISELERVYEVAKADNEEWQAESPEAVLQRTPDRSSSTRSSPFTKLSGYPVDTR